MYKRDLITAEIQKLTEILARILGLKDSGKEHEAETLFAQTLEDQFGLTTALLEDENKFLATLELSGLPVEKLDMLCKFLFDRLKDGDEAITSTMANRLNQLFEFIETKHRSVSMEHMLMQQIVKKHL